MAIASLLRMGSTATERSVFGFEHAMAHRQLYAAMSPLSQFSVLPYFIDTPEFGSPKSLLNHQQAHEDALGALPSFPRSMRGSPTPTPVGIDMAGNLLDEGNEQWWHFVNHQEHYQAIDNLSDPSSWVYPFW